MVVDDEVRIRDLVRRYLERDGHQVLTAASGAEALDIKLDGKETDSEYTVEAEMPGVKKEDIHVQIDGNRVAIQAETKRESEQKDGERVLRSERYYGSVARSFTLASEIDEPRVRAKIDNGVLALALPAAERDNRASIAKLIWKSAMLRSVPANHVFCAR